MNWPEEQLFFDHSSQTFKKFNFPQNIKLLFFSLYFLFLILSLKIFFLDGERWKTLAQANNSLKIITTPPRGLILDRDNKVLTDNQTSLDLIVDLNSITAEEKKFFERIIEENNLNFNIKANQLIIKNIPQELSSRLIIIYNDLLKVRLVDSYKRIYPYEKGFGNLLGYLGFPSQEEIEQKKIDPNIYLGKLGLESYYENYLRGKNGEIVFEKDTKLNIIRKIKNEEPRMGYSLKLTIDAEYQKKAYQIFDNYMKENGYRKGGLIVLKPQTGEIISLISYPDFDNNIFIHSPYLTKEILTDKNQPLFNRVVSGLYAPGSVIKPIIALGALEEKIIDPNKKIYSSGELRIPNPYFPGQYSIFKDWKLHGWVDMKEAIAHSVNVYFYLIGGGYENQKGLGVYKIKEYFKLFGLGQKTGIDFPGEKTGFLPDPETKKKNNFDKIWRLGDTYNLSIGQGDLTVTPLQIAVFTSALATNKVVKPYLVSEILDENKKTIFHQKPEIIKENLVKEENLKIIQEGMRMTVTEGTAKVLNYASIAIAGKSGTPEIYGKKKLNAFFTGYAPYENPEIVMTLFIEEVPIGAVATLPLYKNLIDLYFLENKNN
ncbi:MAG: penicillin-binding transpeptidase domain-containing protein [Patescibacteria group bacterium]|nr:penicillin-binding transpeptidase domain-containing protein [Patescibacteria group bacterium]